MTARIYAAEARAQLIGLARLPAYALPTIAFPVAFYVLFAIVLPNKDQANVERYLLASYGAFGSIGAALFGFGVGVANERGMGWLAVKRASPMPPSAYVFAKVFGCGAFTACIALVLFAVAAFVAHVTLAPTQWLALAAILIFGALPFCAIGLALGSLVPPNSAAAIVNLIYLPLSFCSGLWVPIAQLPVGMRSFAQLLPAYHLGALAQGAVGFSDGRATGHIAALCGWGVTAAVVAVWTMRRDEGNTHG